MTTMAPIQLLKHTRSILTQFTPAVAAAILLGTNTTDVTSEIQSALDDGGHWVFPGPGPYIVSDSLVITQTGTKIVGQGLPELRLDNLEIPLLVVGAKTAVDATNRPTGVHITGLYFNNLATQVDITTSQTNWGTVDKYKTAAGIFIARTVDDGDADIQITNCSFYNWVNGISSYPDCDDEGTGTANGLFVEGCDFRKCNFGLWDAGFSEIFFRQNTCWGTQFIQVSGGSTLPPHLLYCIGSGSPWLQRRNIVIDDCYDYDNPHSSTIKIKGCDNVTIRNLHTASNSEVIQLSKVNGFQIDGVYHPDSIDNGAFSGGSIWLSGCTKGSVRNVGLVQDDDHFVILTDILDDAIYGTGTEGDLECSDIDFIGTRIEVASGASGSAVRNEGCSDIRFHQPIVIKTADVNVWTFYNDNAASGSMFVYEPFVHAASGNSYGHQILFAEGSTTSVVTLHEDKLINISRATSGITSGAGTITKSWHEVTPVSYTAAQIGDITHAVNTAGKYIKKRIYNTTDSEFYFAVSAAAAGNWKSMEDGSTITPA